jgi:hypothetical protein
MKKKQLKNLLKLQFITRSWNLKLEALSFLLKSLTLEVPLLHLLLSCLWALEPEFGSYQLRENRKQNFEEHLYCVE